MPTGDIGTKIAYKDLGPLGHMNAVHISGDMFACAGGTSPVYVNTFTVSSAGVMTLLYGLQVCALSYTLGVSSNMFHISGNVWAVVFVTYSYGGNYTRLVTFTIDPTTGAIAALTNGIIGTLNYSLSGNTMAHNVVHVGGTTYAIVGSQTHSGIWLTVLTFTVSDNGLTIAAIATNEISAGGQTYAAMVEVTANVFAVLYRVVSGTISLKTYAITNAGVISVIDTEALDTASSSNTSVNLVKVSGNVFLLAYGLTGPVYRLRSIAVGNDGVVGATVDTDDTIIGGASVYELNCLGSFCLVSYDAGGATGTIKSFAVAGDGTIGAVIDSYNPTFGLTYRGANNMYVGKYYSGSPLHDWFFSIDVITPDPSIETLGASDIKHDRATLWGDILVVGTADQYGFDWSLDSGSFEHELLCTDPIMTGLFSIDLTSLNFFTSYKFRAKIGVGGVWYYGTTRGFMTHYPIPQVDTELPSATSNHYIDAVGRLMSDGGVSPIDKYGFVYGKTQIDDSEANIFWNSEPNESGYDVVKQVDGTLGAPLLSSDAASGQKVTHVVSAAGLVSGQTVIIADNDNEETNTIDTVVGTTVTMTTNLAYTYYTSKSAQIQNRPIIQLSNLEYGKRYYYRFWAHNSYGYAYGSEICALTSDTVNLLYPIATASKGIRFCVPGKVNFPPTGMYYDTRHHLLVRSPDSVWYPDMGTFGWVIGKYVCERQYWAEATNVDLYTMSNPTKRTNTVIKVKYKTRIGNNSYGLGAYHKRVINNGASSLTSAYIGASGNPGWYCEIFYNNPWTSAPWDITEIDALLMGISIRSGTGWEIPLCDCIEGRVNWANALAITNPGEREGNDVKLNGAVVEDECETCQVWFQWGTAMGSLANETPKQTKALGEAFFDHISAGYTIYYRTAILTACGETFYGATLMVEGEGPPVGPLGICLTKFDLSITYCFRVHRWTWQMKKALAVTPLPGEWTNGQPRRLGLDFGGITEIITIFGRIKKSDRDVSKFEPTKNEIAIAVRTWWVDTAKAAWQDNFTILTLDDDLVFIGIPAYIRFDRDSGQDDWIDITFRFFVRERLDSNIVV